MGCMSFHTGIIIKPTHAKKELLMKINIEKPDVISQGEFSKTEIDSVFISKEEGKVALVESENTLVISMDKKNAENVQ